MFDAVEIMADEGQDRLLEYAERGAGAKPRPDLAIPEFDNV